MNWKVTVLACVLKSLVLFAIICGVIFFGKYFKLHELGVDVNFYTLVNVTFPLSVAAAFFGGMFMALMSAPLFNVNAVREAVDREPIFKLSLLLVPFVCVWFVGVIAAFLGWSEEEILLVASALVLFVLIVFHCLIMKANKYSVDLVNRDIGELDAGVPLWHALQSKYIMYADGRFIKTQYADVPRLQVKRDELKAQLDEIKQQMKYLKKLRRKEHGV